MDALRTSTSQEQPLQASKWLKVPVLLDEQEMQQLFNDLGTIHLYLCGTVRSMDSGELRIDDFLKHYADYIENLKKGIAPLAASYQPWFCPAITREIDALYSIPVGNNQQLIRIAKPIVQMQALSIDYSPLDQTFRTMVYSTHSIPWGIQFSYPQLYKDGVTQQILSTRDFSDTPNSQLFHSIQRWMRQHTIPTPFYAEGKLQNVPVRLGKKCLSWIKNHPSLISKGISVRVSI